MPTVRKINIVSTKKLESAIVTNAVALDLQFIEYNFIKIDRLVEAAKAKAISRCHQNIIFTSANAVRAYQENIDLYGLTIPLKNVFCLEEATLSAVKKLPGIQVIKAAKTAKELSSVIVAQSGMQHLTFFCGNKRTETLPAMAASGNISLEEVVLYHTLPDYHTIQVGYDAILFFSPSAVESFFQTNHLPGKVPCFCIGDTTSAALKRFTGNNILVAEACTQAAVLHCVEAYFKG